MKRIHIIVSFLAVAAFSSCNDWLDVVPKDKVLENKQFSTEQNINSATNGLYRQMAGENLYGGQLSQTTLELMGHVYTYPPLEPQFGNQAVPFYQLGHFSYTPSEVKDRLANIWKDTYSTLLHINVYIKQVSESPALMSEKNRKTLLGEAYGLRAYLHFDLFRLYGPAWQNKNGNKILPYSNKTEVILNHTGYEETEYVTAEQYIDLVLQDIATAENLLKDNDPVIDDAGSITDKLLNDHFYQNRNRRMNYYAVKGLEARVRQYTGEHDLAAQAAKIITDETGSGNRFNWVNVSKIVAQNNYIFFSEVIFGINNLDMVSHGRTWYMGTNILTAYIVDYNNLMGNILGYEGNSLSAVLDIRSKQWIQSNVINSPLGYSVNGTYRSNKYLDFTFPNDGTDIPAIKDLQVLMRVSEMYYIQAEAALKAGNKTKAVELLNTVLQHRGLTEDQYILTVDKTEQELQAHIEKEYYREFTGEGQIFFYHKRHGSTQLFKGYDRGTDPVADPKSAYVVPIPEIEKNI